jgi:anthranilate 1,2-dioxygenase small subunit
MSTVSFEQMQGISDLQMRYIDALDSKDMDAWLAVFGQSGSYVCKTLENEKAGWPIALIMDDCYGRLEDRVKFVTKVWAGTFQDYQTRHFVQQLECIPAGDDTYQLRSNFTIMFTRSDTGETNVLASGTYHDLVELVDDQWWFKSKKVVIDAPLLPHYIVYPL